MQLALEQPLLIAVRAESFRGVLDVDRRTDAEALQPLTRSCAMSVAPVLIIGSVGALYMRVPAASSALKASESSLASGPAGRIDSPGNRTSTAGSLMTFFTISRNFAGSSSGSMRTSSVAFASEGITFER